MGWIERTRPVEIRNGRLRAPRQRTGAWGFLGKSLPLLATVLLVGGFAAPASAAGTKLAATQATLQAVDDSGAAEVRVTFTAKPSFTARFETAKRRLVIDVSGATVRGAPDAIVEPKGVVQGVLIRPFKSGKSSLTRIWVSLEEDAKYSVKVENNQLVAFFRPGGTGALGLHEVPNEGDEQASGPSGPAVARDVRFEHDRYEDRVIIELSRQAQYEERTERSGHRTLRLSGVLLGTPLERTLDVTAFGGVLSMVSSYPDSNTENVAVIDAEIRGSVETHVQRRGKSLVWSFSRPGALPASVTGIAKDGGVARKAKTLHVDDELAHVPELYREFPSTSDLVERSVEAPQAAAAGDENRRFTGRRIDLDLKDADIHNVLRLLADVGRVNIVTADNVSGTVTIRMRNVPWDQALDVILQSKSLGMARKSNILRVAPLAELEKEREMAIAKARQELQLAPLETRLIPVSYASAADIQARAKELLSSRGSIAVDARTNVMIARDVAGNLDQIEELTRSLDTQTPQVLVEARIVEATSRYLRDIGIQWGGDATFSPATGNPTGLSFPSSVGIVGGASDQDTPTAGLSPFQNQVQNPNFAVNLPAAVGTGSGGAIGLTFGSIDSNLNLGVRLSAAESSGMLRILSSPRILTLDNQEARISQGTLIPFSQVSAQGVQTTFQEAKLQLLVQPHVTADGSVAMHVKINRDEPDFNQTSARGDPTILKREAETHLLVMDGHTAVIGGIYTRNTGRNLDQVPFFGDIPILGLLFQHRRASDSRGELVIFLTPRIVNRAEALGR